MMKIGVNIRNAYLLLKADFLKIFINKDGRVFMSRIIKNVLPYWKSIVLVFALLIVQAVCDLSLPAYTSDIIDTGIQNGGIEHTVPEKITKEEFDTAKLFMTEEEAQLWEQSYSYNEDDNVYELSVKGSKNKTDLDDTLFTALIINNQMSSVTESAFKSRMAEQMHVSEEQLANVSIEDIGKSMGVELITFTQMMEDSDGNEVETICVDMRQIVKAMYSAGAMSKDDILSMRSEFQKTIDTMGKTLVSSMGVAYAKSMDAKAGMDMDSIQTKYLWAAGLKMVAMALLMAVTSVCIGFLASRVGAGVARDMRGKLYSNVMGFSNAEMDKFSTASLITRTTNDVQQVQMVTVIMLRMILYAPILGVGGIIKVVGTGAGMGWVIVMAVAVIIAFVMLLMVIAMPKFKLLSVLRWRRNGNCSSRN
jgi:ATP-binding cassette, subfamily B, multidrug efflux pump